MKTPVIKQRGVSHLKSKVKGYSGCPKELDGIECDECYYACHTICAEDCNSMCQAGGDYFTNFSGEDYKAVNDGWAELAQC